MSDDHVDDGSGPGMAFLIGAIIVATSLGYIFGQRYGWLFLGVTLMLWAALAMITATRRLP